LWNIFGYGLDGHVVLVRRLLMATVCVISADVCVS
jgi:hypothetical protein